MQQSSYLLNWIPASEKSKRHKNQYCYSLLWCYNQWKNGCLKDSNEKKYLMLVATDESKNKLKIYEEILSKVKDLMRSISNNSDDYDEKYMKIKFNSVCDLPLKKAQRLFDMVVVFSVFHQGNEYYPQLSLYECLCKP